MGQKQRDSNCVTYSTYITGYLNIVNVFFFDADSDCYGDKMSMYKNFLEEIFLLYMNCLAHT